MSDSTHRNSGPRRPPRAINPMDPPKLVLKDDGTSNFLRWKTDFQDFIFRQYGAWGSIVESERNPTVDTPMIDSGAIIDLKTEVEELSYLRQQLRVKLESVTSLAATSTSTSTSTSTTSTTAMSTQPTPPTSTSPQPIISKASTRAANKGKSKSTETPSASAAAASSSSSSSSSSASTQDEVEEEEEDDDVPNSLDEAAELRRQVSDYSRRIVVLQMREEELREEHKERNLLTLKERQDLTGNKVKLFASLISALSTNSRARVEARSEFARVLVEKSPLDLYLLVKDEHLSPDGRFTSESVVARTTEFWELRQTEKESVQDFRKRFTEALDGLKALGGDVPSEESQSTKFLMALDKRRFGEVVSGLHNNSVALRSNQFPTTLDDAAQYVGQYQVLSRATAPARPAVAYAAAETKSKTKAPSTTDSEGKKKKKKGKSKPKAETAMVAEGAKCWHCGKTGHTMFQCDLFIAHRARVTGETSHLSMEAPDEAAEGFMYPALSQTSGLSATDVILDTGSSASLFYNENLLDNIVTEDTPITFNGVGGRIQATRTGTFGGYGRVWLAEEAPANLLSVSAIQRVDPAVKVTLQPAGLGVSFGVVNHMFAARDGLFIRRFQTSRSFALLPFSYQDLAKAKTARKFEERMGVPSLEGLKYLASISKSVEPRDLDTALELFGPPPGRLGKAQEPTNHSTGSTDILRKEYRHLDLHADLMFIDQQAYFVVVLKPIGLVMSQHLQSGKGAPSLQTSLLDLINECKMHGFQVRTIYIDGEKAAGPVGTTLRGAGIRVVSSPGTHVPVVENSIKMIKNWVRSILVSLKFHLPETLMPHLVAYVCQRINLVPGKRGLLGVPPIVAFLQKPIDLDKEALHPFGMYGHAVIPNITHKNSVRVPRTEAVIVLGNHDRGGALNCLSLSTMRVVVRRKITQLPITRDVIERIQSMGKLTEEGGEPYKETTTPEEVEEAIPGPQLVVDDLKENTPNAAVLKMKTVPPPVIPKEQDQPEDPPTTETPSNEGGSIEEEEVDGEADVVEEDHQESDQEPTQEPEPEVHRSRFGRRTNEVDYGKLHKDGYTFHVSIQRAVDLHGKAAVEAIESELKQMLTKNVFEPTLTRPRSQVINSFLFLKEKKDLQGKLIKIKARLVANGSLQSDEKDNSSPTSSTSGLLIVAAVAAQRGMVVTTADISGAYLNAETPADGRVYMRLDPYLAGCLCRLKPDYGKFLAPDKSMTVALLKALYGCKDSGKLWYEELCSYLKVMGFTASRGDPCVFLRGKTILVIYVDDLFIVTVDQKEADELILALEQKYEALTVNRGKNHEYLGMLFDYTVPGMLKVSMDKYTSAVLDDWPVKKSAPTPAREDLLTINSTSPALLEKDREVLHSMVARLLYLAKKVRPDILLPVIFLTTRVQTATQQDQSKLHRIIQYLSGTKTLGIVFKFDGGPTDAVPCYMDASYGVHMDGKSHSGGVILFGGGPVYVCSRKQKIVTRSSWEAEIVAASDGGFQILWTVQLLRELGFTNMKALLHQDNKGAIQSIEKGCATGATTRHVNIRYFWIKEQISEGTIKVVWVPTDSMIADGLTKPLQGTKFEVFRNSLHNSKVMKNE